MTSNKPTCVTLFSGGGLSALGARDAGFELVGAVEYCAEIAGVYRTNLGSHVTVGKVEEVCPCPYIGIDALLASPVCTRMSIANANRGETEVDRTAAEGVCRWLRIARPQCFVMENVTQYRESDSYRLIMATLYRLGYLCTDDTVNATSFGVAQTRRRMIVRALLGAMPPPLKPTHYNPAVAKGDGGLFAEDTRGQMPWVGWYAAIEDILDTLPESQFAPWQLKRLPAGLTTTVFVEGTSAGPRPPTVLTPDLPALTICGGGGGRVHRAWLGQGRTVRMTTRALARFMSCPDTYTLPASNKLASTVLGNGVPCLLSQRIMEQLKECL